MKREKSEPVAFHLRMGARIRLISKLLADVEMEMQRQYGKSDPLSRATFSAIKKVGAICCDLDDRVGVDCRGMLDGRQMNSIYYGCDGVDTLHELGASTLTGLMSIVAMQADVGHDGHLSIFRFSTGWKAMYGTPEVERFEQGIGYDRLLSLQSHTSIEGCLSSLVGISAHPDRGAIA